LSTDQLVGRRWGAAWLFLLLIPAIWLRTHALDASVLWIDEITIASYGAPPKSAGQIVRDIYADEFKGFTGQHMPFQYVLANWAQRHLRSLNEPGGLTAFRLPFALLGALTVPLFGLFLRRVFGPSAGWWGGVLLTLSFFHVYQSRDATSYGPLLFFQALALWSGWRCWEHRRLDARALKWAALFAAGLLGAFFTHLTAWFFALAVGVASVGAALWRWWRRKQGADIPGSDAPLLALAGLTAVCALPFLKFPLAAAAGVGNVGGVREALTWDLLVYQMACFGWGREDGRLAAFTLVWIWGLVVCWRQRARGASMALLLLLALPVVIFVAVLFRNFFPRYLGIVFLPFLAIAAVGLSDLFQRVAAWRPRVAPVFGALLLILLVAWHVPPYRALYAQRDKLMPMSRIQEWVLKTVPDGGLYMWRNGFFMREVPGALPVPNRQVIAADHPSHGVPREVYAYRSAQARDVFRRFPETALIAEPDDGSMYQHQELWTWVYDFPHREALREESIAKLWRWGFSPHGYLMKESATFTGCHRTPAEAYQMKAQEGRPAVWPTGGGWRYAQTREGATLTTPGETDARLAVFVPSSGGFLLRMRGTAQGTGRVSIWRIRDAQWEKLAEETVSRSDQWQAAWGPWDLQPGDQLSIAPMGERPHFVFIHDFELATP
jgi:hypothetical protein